MHKYYRFPLRTLRYIVVAVAFAFAIAIVVVVIVLVALSIACYPTYKHLREYFARIEMNNKKKSHIKCCNVWWAVWKEGAGGGVVWFNFNPTTIELLDNELNKADDGLRAKKLANARVCCDIDQKALPCHGDNSTHLWRL